MRIIVATDNYAPYIGGAQIQSRVLARGLRKRGHQVLVATVWQNHLPAAEDDDGVPVRRLRQLRTIPLLARRSSQHYQPPFPDPVTSFALRRLIRGFRPDIVQSYGWISYSVAAALRGTTVPYVITARDYAYFCATRTLVRGGKPCSGPALLKCCDCAGRYYGRPKGWIAAVGVLGSRPFLRRRVHGIHSISTFVSDVMRDHFLNEPESSTPSHQVHDVIGNAPSEDAAGDDELARLTELPSEPFILFVGALRAVKGVQELLAAYEALEDPPPLVLLGTVERDTPTHFPPGVHVITDFPHAAVMAACERCLFGVFPSLWAEPFGTVVCEVMSRGKPAIGTAPGGHTDMIIDGETGIVVQRGDTEALASAMKLLIEDEQRRERYGAAARDQARNFTPEVMFPRLEAFYEEAARIVAR